jgi:hypothetical protein
MPANGKVSAARDAAVASLRRPRAWEPLRIDKARCPLMRVLIELEEDIAVQYVKRRACWLLCGFKEALPTASKAQAEAGRCSPRVSEMTEIIFGTCPSAFAQLLH